MELHIPVEGPDIKLSLQQNSDESEKFRFHSDACKQNIIDHLSLCLSQNLCNFADVSIQCSDGTIAAHKLVLASISPMLYSEFIRNTFDETISILMPDCSVAQISDYLISVYKCQDSDSAVNGLIGFDTYFTANALFKTSSSEDKNQREKVEVDVKLEELDKNYDAYDDDDDFIDDEDYDEDNDSETITIPLRNKKSKSSKTKTKKQKKRENASLVWDHFKVIAEENNIKRCICQYCQKIMSSTGGSTSSMRAHLLTHKDQITPELAEHLEDASVKKRKLKEEEESDDPIIDPESGELVTKKDLKKKQRKKHVFTKEKKKHSIVWQYFKKDPDDPKRCICQICFKALVYLGSNSSMFSHINSHNLLEIEPVPCSVCGKMFNNKIARDRHEYRHNNNERKYACELCPKAFVCRTRLNIHMRCHTGEKPYQVKVSDIIKLSML